MKRIRQLLGINEEMEEKNVFLDTLALIDPKDDLSCK